MLFKVILVVMGEQEAKQVEAAVPVHQVITLPHYKVVMEVLEDCPVFLDLQVITLAVAVAAQEVRLLVLVV